MLIKVNRWYEFLKIDKNAPYLYNPQSSPHIEFFALKLRQLITVLRKQAAGLNYLKRKLIFTALPKDKVGNPINYDGL